MDSLKSGNTRSCRCLAREKSTARFLQKGARHPSYKHGESNTKEYRAWDGAKSRCHNKKHKDYKFYGAIGIKMCKQWRHSFETFLADIGHAAEGRSLDRLDCLKGYSPAENCRWATDAQQAANKTHLALLFSKVGTYISKNGRVTHRKVNKAKATKEFKISMTPHQTGICGGCERRCFGDDKFCGREECDNDATKSNWQTYVETTAPAPVNNWN